MLIQRIIFAVLGASLCLYTVALDDEVIVLDGVIGHEIIFEMPEPRHVSRCVVTPNIGPEFTLFPNNTERPPAIDQSNMDIIFQQCGMRIQSPTSDHSGLWKIQAFTNSDGEEIEAAVAQFQLRLTEEDSVIPEDVKLNGVIGQDIHLEMSEPTRVSRCIVTRNSGSEFSLVPNITELPSGIYQKVLDEMIGNCGIVIRSPTSDHSGLWTIQAFNESDGVEQVTAIKRFQVELIEEVSEDEEEEEEEEELEDQLPQNEVSQNVDVFPSRTTNIFSGNSLSLRMVDHYENLSSCIATSPDGHEFDVLNTVNQLSSDIIRSFDQCGVTIRVNNSHAGLWRLDATVENTDEKLYYYGTLNVQVQDLSDFHTEPTVTHVKRGAPANFKIGSSEAISCQLRNPSGQDLPMQSGNCHIDIPVVTDVHEGIWTAAYSLDGEVNLVEEVTEVIAYDDHAFNATVTILDNGEVNLLCQVRAYSYSSCQFVTPNGTVLNIFEGIGNDRYLYYGHGFQSSSMLTARTHECGITILKPDRFDHGAWKCVLSTSSGITGSVLRVPIAGLGGYEDVVASRSEETVYVVKGNSFTVKCKANAVLKYCWMGSPNGTAYSVSSTSISPTTLTYEGMGLSLGECGAVIPAAKDTDDGEWKCGMGASIGQEVTSIVRVIVTDTLLMPDMKNVTIGRGPTHLSCSLIPGHEESIDYCRWIKPSGFGIGGWTNAGYNERRYVTFSTSNSCHLEFENVEKSRDTGNWTCVAGLAGSSLEVSATIQVVERRRLHNRGAGLASWCFGIGLALISVIVAVVFIMIVRIKLLAKEKRDLPPKYDGNHMRLPPTTTMQAQS